jgi:uncharacterized phage-associated protein
MSPESMTGEARGLRLRELIHYILSDFPDKRVSTRRLEKLVYVAELEAIDRFGHRLTDLKFIRDDYGPCSHELLRLAVEDFDFETFEFEGVEGRAFRKPSPMEYTLLDGETMDILRTIDSRWGQRSPDALVEYSRSTDPYKDAELYAPIDFDKYKACADALYRDPRLVANLEQARKDIERGDCVVINDDEGLDEYFDSM